MTNNEEEELRLLQEIYDQCPNIIEDLLHIKSNPVLAKRFMKLKEQKMCEQIDSVHTDIAKKISDQIDADILKTILDGTFTGTIKHPSVWNDATIVSPYNGFDPIDSDEVEPDAEF